MIALSERTPMLEERGQARTKILRGLRWFGDGVIAEELFDAIGVPRESTARDRYAQAITRLADRGEIDRLGCRKPYLYKLPTDKRSRAEQIAARFVARRAARLELATERDADRRDRETWLARRAWTVDETIEFRELVLQAVGRIAQGPTAIAARVATSWPEPFDRASAALRRLERALDYWCSRGAIVHVPGGYRLPIRSVS